MVVTPVILFYAFRARSACEGGFRRIWTVGDAIPAEVLVAVWGQGRWIGSRDK